MELAEPVFSRTFIWKVMKVVKTLPSLPGVPWRSGLGSPFLGGQLVLCLPSCTRSAAQAVMASWTGKRQQLCSPRSAHKMVLGKVLEAAQLPAGDKALAGRSREWQRCKGATEEL